MLDRPASAPAAPPAGPSAPVFAAGAAAALAEDGLLPDYERIRAALEFITRHAARQPSLEEMAGAVGVTPPQLVALFRRFAGLTPKAFLQAVTLDRARRLLDDDAPLLDAALELGLSGPARLHDLFVTHEAMTPGDYKLKGRGLSFAYGFQPTPFGEAVVVAAPRGLAGLGFVENGDREAALADMRRRWPQAGFAAEAENEGVTARLARRVFDPAEWAPGRPLEIVLIGTDFEVRVWRRLLAIPFGARDSYGAVARDLGVPKAARAVGAAVGRNPISFVVPCHRVVGSGGALTGYRWGLTRKRAILGWEFGRASG